MGDTAANGGPPPKSSGASGVTYQANIATVHVKPEGDDASDADQRTISPATRRKQNNGILKKKAPRNPTGTEATPKVPRPDSKVSDSIVPIAVDAIKLDTVNNNDVDVEALHKNAVVSAPPDGPTSSEVHTNGAVPLVDDAQNKKVSWSAETVVYTSREEGEQHPRPANGRPSGLTDDEQRLMALRASTHRQKAASEKATNKCCVAIAVKLLILAVIGIVVLGIMYALR